MISKKILPRLKLFGIFSIFAIIIGFIYWDLPKTFFLQDEWAGFGDILRVKDDKALGAMIFHSIVPFLPQNENIVSFIPTSRIIPWLLIYSLYLLFGINAMPYLIFSIFLHIVNTYLVYFFVTKLTQKQSIGIFAALVFAVNSLHTQAITWISASLATEGSALFLLLSLIYFLKYLQQDSRRAYYFSIGFFIISLLFKESSFFLWVFLPIFDILWREISGFDAIRKQLQKHRFLIVIGLILTAIKFIPLTKGNDIGLFLGGQSENFISRLIYNGIFYPFKIFSQTFFQQNIVFSLAAKLTKIKFPFLEGNTLVEQTIVSELILVLLSAGILIALFLLYKYGLQKNRGKQKILLISMFFLFLSVMPYIVLEQSSFLESRYYYIPIIGSAFLLGMVFWSLSTFITKKIKNPKISAIILPLLIFLILVPYLKTQANVLQKEINKLVIIGKERKKILDTIQSQYPHIGEKSIFFSDSDTSYYGQNYTLMPFQSGFGAVLLMVYADKNDINPQLSKNFFLWNLDAEGYNEIHNQGFGYFRDFNKLLVAVEENGLAPENIYAFQWKNNEISDTTSQIRKKITRGNNENIIKKLLYKEEAEKHKDEHWVYFDEAGKLYITEQQLLKARVTNGMKDTLYTAKPFLNEAWIGGSLGYYEIGNGTDTYFFPKEVYGYEIVNWSGVSINNEPLNPIDYQKTKDGWEIHLPRKIEKDETLLFGLWAAVKQIDVSLKENQTLGDLVSSDILSIAETQTVSFTVKTDTTIFEISGNPPLPKHPNNKTIIFVDGKPTPVEWGRDATGTRLTIILFEPIKMGQLVEIPMMLPMR